MIKSPQTRAASPKRQCGIDAQSGTLRWSPITLHSVQLQGNTVVFRAPVASSKAHCEPECLPAFSWHLQNKRTSARTPTSTPMRVNTGRNLHSATAAWYALRNTCESWISVLRFRTKKNVALFLLLFEGTVSETSKVRPRHRVTRLRRTRCVHQKTWGANDSQARLDLQCPTAKEKCHIALFT